MGSVIIPSPTKQRFMSSGRSMDTYPEDLIGSILSHLESARSLATASATCRKWHDAAMHHLHKLTFIESDFTGQSGHMVPGMQEIIITKLVMKVSCLRELSITASSNFTFQAAPVISWLMHTRKTLKSFVFMNCTSPHVNILEYLGGNLEELRWKFAHIPLVYPAMHCFQSLSLLHLMVPDKLTFGNLKALLLVCPKLEHLELTGARILPDVGAPRQRTLELVSSSLKYLKIKEGLTGVDNLVLHIDCLVTLSLMGLMLKLLKLVHGKGSNALQSLYIHNTEATQVQFDGAASSLLELSIYGTKDITGECTKYREVMSGASNLRALALCGLSKTTSSSIDLRKIASSFPRLRWLAIDYENAFDAFTSHGSTESPFLEKVTDLELACNRVHEGFAKWIAEFLKWCSSLQRLKIGVDDIKGSDSEVLGRFTTLMLRVLRLYPHVDVNFNFDDD